MLNYNDNNLILLDIYRKLTKISRIQGNEVNKAGCNKNDEE